MIHLKQEHIDQINRHAEKDYPHECCGIVFGLLSEEQSKAVTELLPISNSREEQARHNRFLITSEDIMRSEMYARKHKLDVLGFYHSHPDHPARPSAFDLEHAWPTYSYLIVAVAEGQAEELTSWELNTDRSAFHSETIIRED
ncbi:proteasome lid subunit RPN8/RPN11 [Paenibacillus forsythiae]|uniref:Proteasome lid subunit RPN8/RPN11 n=1 Tax=Paenibacillus forsythiae TaxID=365616 RepID=A0ABU3HDE4_9BACL|nr:M67 family metallopeptidase [Paenibacillus forsythiae]MDT3428491.1 proteasome lid subunit RPN8/RPN11 [Paenibacillus forsythiae]